MSEDSTATRILLYLASIWLVVGELGISDHLHNHSVMALVLAGVAGIITATGFMVVCWSKLALVKYVAEPVTMAGVVSSALGFFFHPYAWLTIPVGLIILGAFACVLYDVRAEKMNKAKAAAK